MNKIDVQLLFNQETEEITAFAAEILDSKMPTSEKSVIFNKLSSGLKDIKIRKRHYEETSELIPKQFNLEKVKERLAH